MTQKISKAQQDLVNNLMFEALSLQNLDRFKTCLAKGADAQAKNGLSRTPLMIAVDCNYSNEWIDFLLEKEPDFYARDYEGKNVFDLAKTLQREADRNRMVDKLLNSIPSVAEETEPAPLKKDFSDAALAKDIKVEKPFRFATPSKKDGAFDL